MRNFDPKCYELAEHFYPDATKEFLTELAEQLQHTVEIWDPSTPKCSHLLSYNAGLIKTCHLCGETREG